MILKFRGKAKSVWKAWGFIVRKVGNRTLGELAGVKA